MPPFGDALSPTCWDMLPTKFEVPIFTRYGNMEGVGKRRKWGGWGSFGSPKVTENSAIRYSAYEFQLAFHNNYVSMSYRYRMALLM